MKLRKSKKGFTVVELVIVIAVIAVLSAILIPTFISLDSRAKKASDQSLVSNLNTALAAREGEADDTHNDTMHDAVLDLEKWGYKLDALVTKSGEDLLWDSKTNRFLLSKDAPAADVTLWRIQKAYAGETAYSVYASEGFAATVENLKVGFDAGYNTGITSVSYTGDQDVVIRTDAFTTNVTVNTSASVTHYGKVGKLDIQKVAMASFHEFGDARTVILKEGNLVIEKSGSATLVSVTATESGKAKVDIQGDLDVLAGDSSVYTVTSGSANETVNAAIADDTLAIVNGVAKTSLTAEDFGDGNKIVLLQDYNSSTVALGSCTVVGNLTKLNASITGNKTIVLKNIHTTRLSNSNFTGNLTLDGGLLETNDVNAQNAALYINSGYGSYTIKNMDVAANTNKAIKISKAASVVIENCVFDATKLDGTIDVEGAFTGRSLAAIDIQEQNGTAGKMTIAIKNCLFADVPQGSLAGGVADSDTAGAIKIKTEKAERSGGFEKVTITGNTFKNNYRDVVVGCNVYKTTTATKEQADMDAPGNVVQAPVWEVSGNNTTLTESVIASRGTLTYYYNGDLSKSISERVGRLEGGCGLWETARSARSWLNA